MIIHLIDGTYELFRHFYGFKRSKLPDKPFGAVSGVLGTVVQMLEGGATHVAVATDHVIESFRNELWPDYKTGEGIDPALLAQFHPLGTPSLRWASGTFAMVELEADAGSPRRRGVPPKTRAVQKTCSGHPTKILRNAHRRPRREMDRRSRENRDAARVARNSASIRR